MFWYVDLGGSTHDAVFGPFTAEDRAEIGDGDGWRWEPLTPAEEVEYAR